MWTGAICLSTGTYTVTDDEGFDRNVIEYGDQIPANVMDVTRAEQELATQKGYKADVAVMVFAAAYTGQGYFLDVASGKEYSVARAFKADKANMIQLTGEVRDHGKIGL
ncbi:MAG: hypothetical protein Q4B26_05450 [Eubacteriales bacterium]|nr:hypothetical protein [Eubacteriales bacterium]